MSAMAVAEPSRKGARTPVAMGANVVPYAMARSVVSARGAVVVGVVVLIGGAGGGGGGGVGGGRAPAVVRPRVLVGCGRRAGYCWRSHSGFRLRASTWAGVRSAEDTAEI